MDMFGTGNVSATSTEEFRQKMAEVERMLKEMRERDFSSQRGLAENEEEEAQKCKWSSAGTAQSILAQKHPCKCCSLGSPFRYPPAPHRPLFWGSCPVHLSRPD